jgi:hypothetical protein
VLSEAQEFIAWAKLSPGPVGLPSVRAHQVPDPFSWQTREFAHLAKTPRRDRNSCFQPNMDTAAN